MTNNNPLVDFLRAYGPSSASDNMYDEHVVEAARRRHVEPISETPPRLKQIVTNCDSVFPETIILTGTAGDGKTYHCRKAYLELGGLSHEFAASGKIVEIKLPKSGMMLRIIKDLSELTEAEKEKELDHVARVLRGEDNDKVYLIAANDGQLLKFWRDFAYKHPSYREVEETLRAMLKDELEADPREQLPLRLINLSRQPHHELFNNLLDRVVEHKGWDACEGCEVCATCPIQINRRLLASSEDASLRGRLTNLIRLSAANDSHFPIRQLLLLIVNILLGDDDPNDPLLTCKKAAARAKNEDYRLTNPFQNVFGLNLRQNIRMQYHAFRTLDAYGIGCETNNTIDDHLIYRRPEETGRDDPVAHGCYGLSLFESRRRAYLKGENDADTFNDFRKGIETQRRRMFFALPASDEKDLDPWRLTVFQFGGDYLSFMDKVVRDPESVASLKASLILGLNRTFTGTLCDDRDMLWVASPAANGHDRLGRVLECSPLPIGGGSYERNLFVDFDNKGLNGRPCLTIKSKSPPETMAAMDLRPLLFEYLMRVSTGSLPSSFSRQCYEEVRQFRLKFVGRFREATDGRLGNLKLVLLNAQTGHLQECHLGFKDLTT